MNAKLMIKSGAHAGKHIIVTKYAQTGSGVEIEIRHNVVKKAGAQLRWCQTITENGSVFKVCGKRNYVDPWDLNYGPGPGVCGADDIKPFYWTDAEETNSGGVFSDRPSEGAPASGRSWIQFVTSLAEVQGTKVHLLVAVAWGFDRMSDGNVQVAVLRTPSFEQMRVHGQTLKSMYPTYQYS